VLGLLACFAGAAQAQNGCARLSWGPCDPQVEDRAYTGPGKSLLVESMFGVSAPNVGSDTQIRITHVGLSRGPEPLRDAWRFDDAGCQAGRLTWNNNALYKACPAMKGANSSASVVYSIDTDGSAILRLMSSYDAFTPLPTTRYTVWQLTFDFSLTSAGPTPPNHSTCGGAELCEGLSFDFARVRASDGRTLSLEPCDTPDIYAQCAEATWDGGCVPPDYYPPPGACEHPVATQVETWGRLKALYR
jgi:hypothetical protein